MSYCAQDSHAKAIAAIRSAAGYSGSGMWPMRAAAFAEILPHISDSGSADFLGRLHRSIAFGTPPPATLRIPAVSQIAADALFSPAVLKWARSFPGFDFSSGLPVPKDGAQHLLDLLCSELLALAVLAAGNSRRIGFSKNHCRWPDSHNEDTQ